MQYFQSSSAQSGTVVLIIVRKNVYTPSKRGKIREFHTKLTIVNAKDSLFRNFGKFRSIVEFPGEGLGVPLGGPTARSAHTHTAMVAEVPDFGILIGPVQF